MSLAYCITCLERIDEDNDKCPEHGYNVVFGDRGVSYIEGYRQGYKDAKEQREPEY